MGGVKIPGSLLKFVLNLLAIDYSYTGIWWYVWFYVCYVFLSEVFFKIVNSLSLKLLIICVLMQFFIVEATRKTFMEFIDLNSLEFKIYDHLYYLLGARMLCYLSGMLIAKHEVITTIKIKLSRMKTIKSNFIILAFLFVCSLLLCILSKGILLIFYAIVIFLALNCFKHNAIGIRVFSKLGKYSLYIWLLHPFIYTSAFPSIREWLLTFKYSLLIWGVLLGLSMVISVLLTKIAKCFTPYINKI